MKVKTINDFTVSGIDPLRLTLHKGDIVKNAEETAGDEPIVGDGVWLEYWEAASGKAIPDNCPCCNVPLDRDTRNIHGTHIELEEGGTCFIVPTCNSCNGKHGESLTINYVDEIVAVEAINK